MTIRDQETRQPRIAVIGGGIGGLTLAGALHRAGLTATIHERDNGPHARQQGGTLDLHPESGQRALNELGLETAFHDHARPEGEELRVFDPSGRLLAHRIPEPGHGTRPEIDRTVLRDLLMSTIPSDAIVWGHQLTRIQERPGDGYWLTFTDGSTDECDLLVGADGGRSLVRPLLTDAVPVHLSPYLQLSITDADVRHPDIAELVGPGSVFCLGPNLNLGAQRSGDGTIRVSSTYRADEGWIDRQGLGQGSGAVDWVAVLQRLHDLYAGWSPKLLAMLDACDPGSLVTRNLAALPVGTRWESRSDLTLLGDAAHLMPPVGEGANQAMLDGVLLADAIVASPGDPAAAIRSYEAEMLDRAAVIAAESAEMERMGLAPDAAERMAAFFGAAPGH